MIPKELFRITNHRNPQFQLYQPGFNISNSCWLEGKWIKVPEQEWLARKDKHQELYKDVRKVSKTQHHRNPGKSVEELNPAEKQAYEFFSGTATLQCLIRGCAQSVPVENAGDKVKPESIKWIKSHGFKVIARVKGPDGATISQLSCGIPEDLIVDTGEPFDFWKSIVDQNKKKAKGMFDASLSQLNEFSTMIAVQSLIEVEEEIIQAEHKLSLGQKDLYTDLEEETARYVGMRKEIEDKGLHEAYERGKLTHNECARSNLDNSNGFLFCFVLPKFNTDGTHEPWGERDVPWSRVDK
jgi:hypothetical protein